jgi:hypothetical protein
MNERIRAAVERLAGDGIVVTAQLDGDVIRVRVVATSRSAPDTWWLVFEAFQPLGYGVQVA